MGSQNKSSRTKANGAKANNKTSKVAKSANREQQAKRSRWRIVVAPIVALAIIAVVVIVAITAICGASPRNNFTVESSMVRPTMSCMISMVVIMTSNTLTCIRTLMMGRTAMMNGGILMRKRLWTMTNMLTSVIDGI